MSGPRLAVLGAGSLARALLAGWAATHTPFTSVTTVNRTAASAAATVASRVPEGTRALSLDIDPDANRVAVGDADVVIVAVKPYMVADLLPTIADALAPGAVVVSVAAGIRRHTFTAALPGTVHVLRAMPNTPSAVARGVIGLVPDDAVPAGAYAEVEGLFSRIGLVAEVDDEQLDGIVAIAGSGPAYVFLMIEKLRQAALAQGFAPEMAGSLAQQVFAGAVELLDATGEDPAALRRKVTSPNGTTERAIAAFEEGGLGLLVESAVQACRVRARELAGD